MKTAIVYYSMSGNTAAAAKKVAEGLHADLIEIKPEKAFPDKGFKKFLWGGKSAVMSESPRLRPYEVRLADYGRVVLGFPVWAGSMAPPIRTFLRENDLSGLRVAAFACESGAGAERAFGKLKACLGVDALEAELILIDPKDKPSAENDGKIAAFCAGLAGKGA